ncbi:hypothetical protein ACFV4M_07085 [Kitasatospora indigofera]|uniref:hypothetical protein n=1 Tax=Kitasatospora indigofera TaxID=67307 RepID=UPI003654739B
MSVKAVTCYVVTCDVCGTEYGSTSDDECTVHSTTSEAAATLVRGDTEWLVTLDRRVICLAADQRHQDALDALLPPAPPVETDGQLPLALDL